MMIDDDKETIGITARDMTVKSLSVCENNNFNGTLILSWFFVGACEMKLDEVSEIGMRFFSLASCRCWSQNTTEKL